MKREFYGIAVDGRLKGDIFSHTAPYYNCDKEEINSNPPVRMSNENSEIKDETVEVITYYYHDIYRNGHPCSGGVWSLNENWIYEEKEDDKKNNS